MLFILRTVISGGGGGDEVEVTRNYQVYRGMSPTTSNRLEVGRRWL